MQQYRSHQWILYKTTLVQFSQQHTGACIVQHRTCYELQEREKEKGHKEPPDLQPAGLVWFSGERPDGN